MSIDNDVPTLTLAHVQALASEWDHELFMAQCAGTRRDRERHENTAAGIRAALALIVAPRAGFRVNVANSRDYGRADYLLCRYRPYPNVPSAPASDADAS